MDRSSVSLRRRYLIAAACCAAAAAIALVAIADHRWEERRQDRAQVAEWYCAHTGTRCGGPSSRRIERHWNEREAVYIVAALALGTVGLTRFATALRDHPGPGRNRPGS